MGTLDNRRGTARRPPRWDAGTFKGAENLTCRDETTRAVAAPVGAQSLRGSTLANRPDRACPKCIPTFSLFDEGARPESKLDGGDFMRYRLDDRRLPPTFATPPSESLKRQFASLSAGIDKRLEQVDMRIVAAEEAVTAVRSMRSIEKIAAGETRRL